MTDVFISYSHKDFEYAHRLADELRQHQVDVWIDDRIDYGDQWPRTIQENLTACRTFIVIMSTNAYNSMWVQNEVSYAQANHKTIFPLLLEGNVWLSMASMQYVDVSNEKMPPERFFEKVRNSLKFQSRPIPPVDDREYRPVHRKPRTGMYIAGLIFVVAIAGGVLFRGNFPNGNPTHLIPTDEEIQPLVTEGPLPEQAEPVSTELIPTDFPTDCIVTIRNPLVSLMKTPDRFGQELIRLSPGEYYMMDYKTVSFASRNEGWFQIESDGRVGWIPDDTLTIESKTNTCP